MGDSDVRLGQREQLSCRLFRAWDTNRNAPRVVPGPFIAIIRVRVTSCVACREGSAKWGRYVIMRHILVVSVSALVVSSPRLSAPASLKLPVARGVVFDSGHVYDGR